MEAELFAADSPETRESNMGKLREMISALGDLDARLKASMPSPQESPREAGSAGAAGGRATPVEDELNEMGADYGESDDEAVDAARAEESLDQPGPQAASSEEMARLVELMSEQQTFLQQLLQESAEKQAETDRRRMLDSLLEQVMQEQTDSALSTISAMRPQDLSEAKDLAGMTALHWATKMGNRTVVWHLLDRAPDLANVPTSWHRQPPHWTPLMLLADLAPASVDMQVAKALAASMTVDGLNVRSGTYATATHLATARGNLALVKVILWRLEALGGKPVVTAHLKMANQMAGISVHEQTLNPKPEVLSPKP